MTFHLARRAGSAVLGTAAVAAVLALSPAANAAPAPGQVSCKTEISSSATSGASTTTRHCTRDGRAVPAPSADQASAGGTAVKPGALAPRAGGVSADSRGWISTGLHFRNSTSRTVSVTIMYYDPSGCAGYGDWGTQGWWNVAPGAEVNVKNTSNRYATFYAHSSALTWSGPYSVYVRSTAFTSCVGIGSTASRIVGERLVDLGSVGFLPYDTYTVNLVG